MKAGRGTTLELVADRTGFQLGPTTDGANGHGVKLRPADLADIPPAVTALA